MMFENTKEMFDNAVTFIAKKNKEMADERKERYYAPVQSALELLYFLVIVVSNSPLILLQSLSLLVVLTFEKMSMILFNDDQFAKSASISDVFELIKKQTKASLKILDSDEDATLELEQYNRADKMIYNIGDLISNEFKRSLPDSNLGKAWGLFGKFILVIYAFITFAITIPLMLLKQYVVEPLLNHVLPFIHLNITATLFNGIANLPLRLLDGLKFLKGKCFEAMAKEPAAADEKSNDSVKPITQSKLLLEPHCFPCFSWWKSSKTAENAIVPDDTTNSMKKA